MKCLSLSAPATNNDIFLEIAQTRFAQFRHFSTVVLYTNKLKSPHIWYK